MECTRSLRWYPRFLVRRETGGSLLYYRDMIRIRADVVPGYTASNALGPDGETWPRDGEIDFPEGELNGAILCWRRPRSL